MTCIFEGLGGNVAARNKVFKLVIAHNDLLVPTSANTAFEDSVRALRVADQNLFGGPHGLINSCALGRRLIATLPSDTTRRRSRRSSTRRHRTAPTASTAATSASPGR